MRGIEEDTIGGFNSMIEKQRKEDGEVYISTVLFDDKTEILYDRVPVAKVEPMNEKQYYVRGCAPIREDYEKRHKDAKRGEDDEDKYLA